MTPLPFWQLLLGFACLLVVGHIVAWWIWRALEFSGPRLGRGLTGLAYRRKFLASLQRRAPKTTRIVGARLSVDRFSGLPLTLFVALALYLIVLAAGLLEDLFPKTLDLLIPEFIIPCGNRLIWNIRNPMKN